MELQTPTAPSIQPSVRTEHHKALETKNSCPNPLMPQGTLYIVHPSNPQLQYSRLGTFEGVIQKEEERESAKERERERGRDIYMDIDIDIDIDTDIGIGIMYRYRQKYRYRYRYRQANKHVHIHIYIYMYTHTANIHTYIYIYICIYIYVYIYMYIYIYVYIYNMYIYIYTYTKNAYIPYWVRMWAALRTSAAKLLAPGLHHPGPGPTQGLESQVRDFGEQTRPELGLQVPQLGLEGMFGELTYPGFCKTY